MNDNKNISIRALENGFLVELSYRERKASKDSFDYDYVEKKYMFADWDGVTKWVSDNALDMPPKII